MVKNLPAIRRYKRHWFNPWVRNILWRRGWRPLQSSCLENSHRQRRLMGYSPWSHKELNMTEWPSIAQHAPFLIIKYWEFHGQRKLACYSPWGSKESDMTEPLTQRDTVYITVLCNISLQLMQPTSLYLLILYQYIAPSPFPLPTNLFSISVNLLFCYAH